MLKKRFLEFRQKALYIVSTQHCCAYGAPLISSHANHFLIMEIWQDYRSITVDIVYMTVVLKLRQKDNLWITQNRCV